MNNTFDEIKSKCKIDHCYICNLKEKKQSNSKDDYLSEYFIEK